MCCVGRVGVWLDSGRTFCSPFPMLMSVSQGLLSISRLDLRLKLATGTEQEKKHAKSLMAITEHHHLLLVTLLLLNATAMELLPIAMDKVLSRAGAIILSVTLVLLMGEILPASVMTGIFAIRISEFSFQLN